MASTDQLASSLASSSPSSTLFVFEVLAILIVYDLIKRFLGDYFSNTISLSFVKATKKNQVFVELRINYFCKLISEINSIQEALTFSKKNYSNQLIKLKSDGALFLDSTEQKLIQDLHDLIVRSQFAAIPNFIELSDKIKEKLIGRAKL